MSKRRNRAIRNVSEKANEVTTGVTPAVSATVEQQKPSMETEVFVEYDASQIRAKDVVQQVKDKYKEEGKNIDDIRKLNVYIKPEDNAAYYVINDDENGKIEL